MDDAVLIQSKPSVEVAVDAEKIGEMFETGDRDVSPMTKATKYEGEDQMLFDELEKGQVFGFIPHIFRDQNVLSPFTIKTNEKTRLLVIEKEGVDKFCSEFLRQEFMDKYNFLKQLKYFGDTRLSFHRILPIVSQAKLL